MSDIHRELLSSCVGAATETVSLRNLSPWFCPSIRGPTTFDSERDKGTSKVFRPHTSIAPEFRPAVEQFIGDGGVDAIPSLTVKDLHQQLAMFGMDEGKSGWTKAQLQEAIMAMIETDFGGCSKMFVKPVGTSGGVMFMLCPHGFIYGFKVMLRAESVSVSNNTASVSVSSISLIGYPIHRFTHRMWQT